MLYASLAPVCIWLYQQLWMPPRSICMYNRRRTQNEHSGYRMLDKRARVMRIDYERYGFYEPVIWFRLYSEAQPGLTRSLEPKAHEQVRRIT